MNRAMGHHVRWSACVVWAGWMAAIPAWGIGQGQTLDRVILDTDAEGVQRTTMILDSYSYSPNYLIVEAGKPVELTLNSITTLTPHNFVLREPAVGLMIDQDVAAGKSKTIRFTASRPGLYSFYCDKKLLFFKSHREKGMEGLIEVR